ncbi:S1C family serine protease [Micromonospora cathayae]|uniref:Trypsin-like peptidase domain-containing protein n=1 Tax=Micromonospora cathayae TaxID=3028804 RepID=A0ABY7ZYT8_9ACTN|nr:trypsin-like peptidase domain-containing protein [Micromonospora sp. HUAS 3]WDZ88065.1 trypsin-like peptidase domain-containing protein [Micromonospora sp. HUAS 3]
MTAGYGPQDGGPRGPAQGSGDEGGRPGPLPPRMEPRGGSGGWPTVPASRATAPGQPPGYPAGASTGYPSAPGAPAGYPASPGAPAGGYPSAPGAPAAPAVPTPRATWSPAPEAGQRTPQQMFPPQSGQPADPRGWSGAPAGPPTPVAGPGAAHPAATRPKSGWLPRAALFLALVLVLVSGVQAYQIHRLNSRLADTDRNMSAAQGDDGVRLDGLEQRAEELEKQAGTVFNPESIAAAVLPSVFRVKAGQFTGTAFAVGKPNSEGGANLFTNYHVVESVWDSGGRQVFLERTDQRFPATIVKVDEENDIAHLRTSAKFTGLVTAPTPVKSGQQIVVVGAPLGLTDSVTTGVVSAFRKAENGSGDVIQFDAPINPGNSGGPVINGAKQVVGIATAKARDAEGIGLAVPIKTACDGFDIC